MLWSALSLITLLGGTALGLEPGVDADASPACVVACPTGARQLADLKNPRDPVHEFLRNNPVQVLKPHMATGAKVFYKSLDGAVR